MGCWRRPQPRGYESVDNPPASSCHPWHAQLFPLTTPHSSLIAHRDIEQQAVVAFIAFTHMLGSCCFFILTFITKLPLKRNNKNRNNGSWIIHWYIYQYFHDKTKYIFLRVEVNLPTLINIHEFITHTIRALVLNIFCFLFYFHAYSINLHDWWKIGCLKSYITKILFIPRFRPYEIYAAIKYILQLSLFIDFVRNCLTFNSLAPISTRQKPRTKKSFPSLHEVQSGLSIPKVPWRALHNAYHL